MPRFHSLVPILGLLAALLWVELPGFSKTASLPSTGLVGTVKSSDGKPMEGVAVSARAQDKNITTSVYSDQKGQYFFPPLDAGQYRIWAQAVGFELTRAEQMISSGKRIQQDFTLKPVADFSRQLSDAEWLESLPDGTPADRRMKNVIHHNCVVCHGPGFALEKRFDAAGWETIFNYMVKIGADTDAAAGKPPQKPGGGAYPSLQLDEDGLPLGAEGRLMAFYKADIIEYLSRVRGPKPYPLKLKPFPRPTGEATQIVVTEYDVEHNRGYTLSKLDPQTGRTTHYSLDKNGQTHSEGVFFVNNEYRSGSDWSLGIRSDEQEADGNHDIALGTDGNLYYAQSGTTADPRGYIWTGSEFIKFDIETGKLQRYPRPSSMGGFHNGKEVDSKGNAWATQPTGAVRINPETGVYTEFKAVTPLGRPYDMAIDSEDKVWFAQIAVDKLGIVDTQTGEVSEVALPPLDEEISAQDREIGQSSGAWTMNAPLYQKGPRRMGADPNGNTVWVGEFWAGRLAKIDIHTKKITEYKVPEGRYADPYKIRVDKNHMVWFTFANADRFARFNPVTEKFTMYSLPTRASDSRHFTMDNSTDVPTLWISYTAAAKIARVQFRTNTAH